ncbi:MAG: histidinol-phosphate transaminase [Proteobacteria bacterium]|nr:histidinol-phosphate transaminase [Pseudomonadota bacterium]
MTAPRIAPQPRPGVLQVAAYVPGPPAASGHRSFKLSSNESVLGPTPLAVEAFHGAATSLHVYPDSTATALRTQLQISHGIPACQIVCGAGSDELLKLIGYCYLRDGDEAIFSRYAFVSYLINTLAAGATPVVVDEQDYRVDLGAMLERVTSRTRVVFLANPNNPTGTYVPRQEIIEFHRRLPQNVLLVLDEAYAEYVTRDDYGSCLALAAAAPNVVVLRTFSKIYGLAALRLGWCAASPPIVQALQRIRPPFSVSSAAALAGVAAIGDLAHLEAALRHNERWRPWLAAQIAALGYGVTPSVTNFLLLHFDPRAGESGIWAFNALAEQGLILRPVDNYELPHSLRLTVGTAEANQLVVDGLRTLRRRTAAS